MQGAQSGQPCHEYRRLRQASVFAICTQSLAMPVSSALSQAMELPADALVKADRVRRRIHQIAGSCPARRASASMSADICRPWPRRLLGRRRWPPAAPRPGHPAAGRGAWCRRSGHRASARRVDCPARGRRDDCHHRRCHRHAGRAQTARHDECRAMPSTARTSLTANEGVGAHPAIAPCAAAPRSISRRL